MLSCEFPSKHCHSHITQILITQHFNMLYFYIHSIQNLFFISFVISLKGYLELCSLVSKYLDFFFFFWAVWLISGLFMVWSVSTACVILILLSLLRLMLSLSMWSVLVKVPCHLWRMCWSWVGCPPNASRSSWFLVLFISSVSFLIITEILINLRFEILGYDI